MRVLLSVIRYARCLFGSQRKLWVPFLAVAFIEALFLGLLWLAPQPPFSSLLAPPIRYFFGDRVLHYPWHLLFLYHAMKHTGPLSSIVAGAFFSGIACVMVRQIHEGAPLSFRDALVSRQVRFLRVTLLWLITWGLARVLVQSLSHVTPKAAWLAWTAIGLLMMIQALMVYTIPAAVFNDAPWWKAVLQSLRETLRYPFSTGLVVVVPSGAVMVFSLAFPPVRVAQLMSHTSPEIAVVFVAARLLLLTVADTLLTVSVAHLWWLHRAVRVEAVGVAPVAVKPTRLLEGGPAVA